MKKNITVEYESEDNSYTVKKNGKSKLTLEEIQEAMTERYGSDELMFVVIRTGYWDDTMEMIRPADSDIVSVYPYDTMKKLMSDKE